MIIYILLISYFAYYLIFIKCINTLYWIVRARQIMLAGILSPSVLKGGMFTLYVLLRRQHSGSVPALLLPSYHNQHSLNQISLIRNLFLIQQIDRYKCRNTFFLHRYSVENIRSIHCSTPMSDDNKLCIFRQFMQILRIPVYI